MLLLLQVWLLNGSAMSLNGETGKIDFVGKEKMAQLLEKHPEWKKAYLTKDSQEAKHTFKYLQMLCGEQQKE